MIALLDYGAGNLASVTKAFRALGAEIEVTTRAADVRDAAAVVVPGVGHFDATRAVDDDVRHALEACVQQKPLLGICLGLQFLFEGSAEAPDAPGLAAFDGRCTPLPPTMKVPHVGWNTIDVIRPSRLLLGIPAATSFYFTHSYAAPVTDACVGRTKYTTRFAAAVESGLVFGVQFHPEKSGQAGLAVLRNFLAVVSIADGAVAAGAP